MSPQVLFFFEIFMGPIDPPSVPQILTKHVNTESYIILGPFNSRELQLALKYRKNSFSGQDGTR